MIDPERMQTLVDFYGTLADPTRLKMVGLLALRPRRGQELAIELCVSAPTVSHHIGRLKKLSLVKALREEDGVYYSLDTERLQQLSKSLLAQEEPEERSPASALSERQKVLKSFFVDGRLKDMPVQHKKKLYVLEEILRAFAPGSSYEEKAVNETIKNYFQDFCTIRREFINNGYMSRQGGTYWVNPPEKWMNQLISEA